MSNEYLDWMTDKIQEEKLIVEKYPFLQIRDIDGTVDVESKYPMIPLEIPNGWYNLFFQLCDDIKPILEKEGVLNDYYFIQVKEKYNLLRCYPSKSIKEVDEILAEYENAARYICCECGASAVYEAQDYLASYCENHWKDKAIHKKCKRLDI